MQLAVDMKHGCKGVKILTSPPEGYPDPYGVPNDGTPCRMPPGGYGTDFWARCVVCGAKLHYIMGKIVEDVGSNHGWLFPMEIHPWSGDEDASSG